MSIKSFVEHFQELRNFDEGKFKSDIENPEVLNVQHYLLDIFTFWITWGTEFKRIIMLFAFKRDIRS